MIRLRFCIFLQECYRNAIVFFSVDHVMVLLLGSTWFLYSLVYIHIWVLSTLLRTPFHPTQVCPTAAPGRLVVTHPDHSLCSQLVLLQILVSDIRDICDIQITSRLVIRWSVLSCPLSGFFLTYHSSVYPAPHLWSRFPEQCYFSYYDFII